MACRSFFSAFILKVIFFVSWVLKNSRCLCTNVVIVSVLLFVVIFLTSFKIVHTFVYS